jgi:hypothetical protein
MNEIETGIERDSDVPTNADVYAYVDDEEHAVVWAVTREDDYHVTVTAWLCEAGLIDRDVAYGTKHFELDPQDSTVMWAKDYAKGHKGSIEHAKTHFE